MGKRLRNVTDWPERALRVRWCATRLAKACGVSLSTLERHFHETMGLSPRAWLAEDRMRRANELLKNDSSVKEAAMALGFKNPSHFSLAFKKHNGDPPSGRKPAVKWQAAAPLGEEMTNPGTE